MNLKFTLGGSRFKFVFVCLCVCLRACVCVCESRGFESGTFSPGCRC